MDSTQNYDDQRPAEIQGDPGAGGGDNWRAEVAVERPPRPQREQDARVRKLPYKSASLAAFMSLCPGLGQVFLGYYQRGFMNLVVVAGVITLLASGSVSGLEPLFGIFLAFYWLYNIVDAYRRATLYNQVLDGLSSVELPEDIQLNDRGSTAGGVVLVVAGFVLFLHTKFDVSLAWVNDWWPLAAIAFGAYLIYKSRQNR